MISARPTCKVDEVDGLISAYNGTRYLVLFGPEKYDAIYNRIRSLKSQESGIIQIKIDFYDLYDLYDDKNVFDSITMLRSGATKVANEECYGVKNPITVWDVDVNNIVIS